MTPRFAPIAAAALLAMLPAGRRATATGQAQDPEAAATCGMCHGVVHGEWKGSRHAAAWTDPIYQKALKGRDKAQLCYPCHVPASVLERLGQKPRVREVHRDDGVSCLACHRQGEQVHGPYGTTTDAHPVVKDAAFTDEGSSALCSSCHNLRIADVLPVAKDFEAAGLQQKGKSCTGCHMPAVERQCAQSLATGKPVGTVRKGRSHALRGPGDPEFCKLAFGLRLEGPADKLVLHLVNEAGHGVPGLDRLRTFPITVRLLDAGGKTVREHKLVISSDNPLLVEEDRRVALPAAAGVTAVEVQIDHVHDGKATTVTRQRLEAR
jgi:hypothetical protein